jgi:hypothetical protein
MHIFNAPPERPYSIESLHYENYKHRQFFQEDQKCGKQIYTLRW